MFVNVVTVDGETLAVSLNHIVLIEQERSAVSDGGVVGRVSLVKPSEAADVVSTVHLANGHTFRVGLSPSMAAQRFVRGAQ